MRKRMWYSPRTFWLCGNVPQILCIQKAYNRIFRAGATSMTQPPEVNHSSKMRSTGLPFFISQMVLKSNSAKSVFL